MIQATSKQEEENKQQAILTFTYSLSDGLEIQRVLNDSSYSSKTQQVKGGLN